MKKLVSLLILLSILLGACAKPSAPVAEVTQAPAVTEAPPPTPTPLPPTPTEEPLDFLALFQEVIQAMPPDKGYGTVKVDALSEELATQPPFLLDVREPAELEKEGFIEGAVNIPVRELLKNLDKLPGMDEPIVIYCASGHRGAMAFAALKMLGYTKVRNLAGGLNAWKKAELPVATGSVAAAQSISKPTIENQRLLAALDEFLSALPTDKGSYTVKADKLNEDLASGAKLTLVDVRTEKEFQSGYIEGAINLPLETILSNLDQLPNKDAAIVIYCVSGHRGGVVTMALRMLGYTNVVNLAGGINAWKAAQLPLVGAAVDWMSLWTEFLTNLPADKGYYTITAQALNEALASEPPFLLDVREAAELEKDGYIAGAVNIPVREVLKNLDKLPAQDKKIVVYCASGHRGAFITAALRFLGWTDVVNLAGGLNGWKKAEFAVEMGMPEAPVAGTAPAVDAQKLADLDAFLSALPDGFYTVKAADLNTELASAAGALTIVDVRTAEEFAEGHIEGSVNIPVNEFMANLSQMPDKNAKIVILCKSGHRGALVTMALRMLGYTDVRNLAGGINAWVAAELPVVK
ncbi:MAG: rhodanese-like domain-containing protein [Anaerolineales bacterium]|nr:rhodanese-like domain-containing protein [Anaerolineales bacterium]